MSKLKNEHNYTRINCKEKIICKRNVRRRTIATRANTLLFTSIILYLVISRQIVTIDFLFVIYLMSKLYCLQLLTLKYN